jgi:hypothetical protein
LDTAYRRVFLARGDDLSGADPAAADRVVGSPIRQRLTVALTDWASYTADAASEKWLLAAARRADPGGWADRLRELVNAGPEEAVRLAAWAPVAELPPHL